MNSILNSSRIKTASLVSILFLVISGLSMFISKYFFNADYGSPLMIYFMIPVELIMAAVSVVVISKSYNWRSIGFRLPEAKSFYWIVPIYLLLLFGWVMILLNLNYAEITRQNWKVFSIYGFLTLLVGFSEEIVFRGILLQSQTLICHELTFSTRVGSCDTFVAPVWSEKEIDRRRCCREIKS